MPTPTINLSDNAIISFRDAKKHFVSKKGVVAAVDGVSLDIRGGEIFGVIGYSGAGKSTLVRLINALEPLTSGQAVVDGKDLGKLSESDLRQLRQRVGMIFQQFNLFNSRSVAANVAYPLQVAGWSRQKRKQRVAELLDFVGLSEKAKARVGQLSGGQKQRVGVARALANNPKILLADEATSALDPETTQDVLDLLVKVNRELGITIVIITHEMDVVKYACDRVAVMEHGQVVELGDVYDVFTNPTHPVSAKFVSTALRDKPSRVTLDRLRVRHPGRIVVVGVNDTSAESGDVTSLLAARGVNGAVIYGGITEIKQRPYGSLTLELTGASEQIEAFIADAARLGGVLDLGSATAPNAAGLEQLSSRGR